MAALSANDKIVYDGHPAFAPLEKIFKTGAITDEFYKGSLATYAVGTGLIVVTSADASEFLGLVTERKSFTGTAGVCKAYISGIFWAANTSFTDANYGKALACTAASDAQADITLLGAGTTGQIGRLVHVDVTGTSGWYDIGVGARAALGTNS